MSVVLHVKPLREPMFWGNFKKTQPKNSIALDGYVKAGPRFDPEGPWANFNHHEEVDRLATRATCGQVLMAIRQGLFGTFVSNNPDKPLNLFVNDCDEDVCTAVFLLRHGYMAKSINNPALNRLVFMEDALDTTAGAYPFPADMPILEQLAWVFEPYRIFRTSGRIDLKDATEYRSIIEDVELRISAHIAGSGKSVPLDTRYERVGGGQGWIMAKEIGNAAKTGIIGDGHTAYVTVRERPDGNYTYTVGKTAFNPLFLPNVFYRLNRAETEVQTGTSKDCWGGSTTIGGSPRVAGSKLTPEQVSKIIEECPREYRNA